MFELEEAPVYVWRSCCRSRHGAPHHPTCDDYTPARTRRSYVLVEVAGDVAVPHGGGK